MLWGKLHQFANELMAPIDDEEDEEEYDDQQQHHQHGTSANKEDAFFSQTFLTQPQHSHSQHHPIQQQQHSNQLNTSIPSSLINSSNHKRSSSSASFNGQTTTSRDSPVFMQHSASYQHLPNAAFASSNSTLSSSPPNLHNPQLQSNYKSSLLETASTFFKSTTSPSGTTSQNRTHSPYSDQSGNSVSIKSPMDNISDGGVSTHPIPILTNNTNQLLKTKESSVVTPVHQSSVPPPQIPGFLLNGYKSFGDETTQTDNPNHIHVKLCIGQEITYNDQHVEYLQSQITYLQHEIANQADRFEKEKSDLKHLLENTQHAYREQNLKLNECIEQNRRLEYDLQQLNTSASTHISKLESNVHELTNHKKQLIQTINDQDVKLQQIFTELQREQSNARQYNIELERERSMSRNVENQNSESLKLLQEREKELADLELALEQLQMLSGKEGSKLKQVIKQKDEEILDLKESSVKLIQQVKELDVLRQQVEQYEGKIGELESTTSLETDSNNNQSRFNITKHQFFTTTFTDEIFKRMLEDCTSRLNDENLIDRRVVSRMLLALVSNHADTRQQQAIFKFFLKTLNINNQDDEQLLQHALVFLQQERFKQLLSRKKTFSELFVNYLLEEGNKTNLNTMNK